LSFASWLVFSCHKRSSQVYKLTMRLLITNGVPSPAETRSKAHPVSYPMGTGALFPGVKCGRGVTLTAHPLLVQSSRMSRSYIFFPLNACVACNGATLLYEVPLCMFLSFSVVINSLRFKHSAWPFVHKMNDYHVGDRVWYLVVTRVYLHYITSRPLLGSKHWLPIATGSYSSVTKQTDHKIDYSSPSN
jgi:hypothetical protein